MLRKAIAAPAAYTPAGASKPNPTGSTPIRAVSVFAATTVAANPVTAAVAGRWRHRRDVGRSDVGTRGADDGRMSILEGPVDDSTADGE
ncbi:hypothetical protein [Fodinicola feengrottensis]|uniref:Uncharacterized protein n=1 Tax=Fodinicola feengrottensis TaxID=435914 RepID=A0ABP4RLS9_9ACTN|nr:hypothetical protein [Fodinicola feengrottensis]